MRLGVARHALATTLAFGLMFALTGCGNVDDGREAEGASGDLLTLSQGISLGSALGKPVYTSGTCGLANAVTPSCTTSTASDMSFEWIAPSAGTFTFSTVGSNFDTVLVIADYYTPSSVLACAGSVVGTGGESTSLNLSSGRQLLVTVDGYASLCGSFALNITKNCTFNGVSYQHDQSVASGVRCSAKTNGYCIGGVFAGSACAANGECYATCNNGVWE
jgi:hypothetical protein